MFCLQHCFSLTSFFVCSFSTQEKLFLCVLAREMIRSGGEAVEFGTVGNIQKIFISLRTQSTCTQAHAHAPKHNGHKHTSTCAHAHMHTRTRNQHMHTSTRTATYRPTNTRTKHAKHTCTPRTFACTIRISFIFLTFVTRRYVPRSLSFSLRST